MVGKHPTNKSWGVANKLQFSFSTGGESLQIIQLLLLLGASSKICNLWFITQSDFPRHPEMRRTP